MIIEAHLCCSSNHHKWLPSRWKTHKERPNQSTNNRDMAEGAKSPVVDGIIE